ncbi:hypothetical protein GJR98_15040 [Haloferax sp. MBLA0077]|uniref:ZIP family metal transporter n=2 Tax=Haloferax TaxID=2251 RepID=A0A6G1Z639_9EURY|nr:hypothetical protein Hfx1149_15085 [Haloferax sp. CBA1149]MRW82020.1 hypothetical protein [Haloferax marinisediminis]
MAAGVFALGLAAVHLASGRLDFAHRGRRRQFLSAGGGASVAYVFVLMLPEVAEAAATVSEARGGGLFPEQLVFIVALTGFVLYYGIEVFVTQRWGEDVEESKSVYRVHLVSFMVYSGIIGYLLFHQEVETLPNLFFYAVAMALHFGVTDYGFHRHYGAIYDTRGRIVLAVGTLVGAAIGAVTEIGEYQLSIVFAFVAGAIVFNVLKEELPDLTESRFVSFVLGTLAFVTLALLT